MPASNDNEKNGINYNTPNPFPSTYKDASTVSTPTPSVYTYNPGTPANVNKIGKV